MYRLLFFYSFLGLLLLYLIFLLLYLCVMCVCRISIKITYLLTYLGHPAHKSPVVVPVSLSFMRAPAHLGYPGSEGRKMVVHLQMNSIYVLLDCYTFWLCHTV